MENPITNSLWGFAHQHSAAVPLLRSKGEGGERERGGKEIDSFDKINKHSPPRKNSEWCSKITSGSTALALPWSSVEVKLDRPRLQWAKWNQEYFLYKLDTVHRINSWAGKCSLSHSLDTQGWFLLGVCQSCYIYEARRFKGINYTSLVKRAYSENHTQLRGPQYPTMGSNHGWAGRLGEVGYFPVTWGVALWHAVKNQWIAKKSTHHAQLTWPQTVSSHCGLHTSAHAKDISPSL